MSPTGTATVTAPTGTLARAQKATLARMAEEEKLAHDLYTAFAARYDAMVFDRIAAAETRHLGAVRTLLDPYDVADPTAGKAAGDFADATVQAMYDGLLKQGTGSAEGALKVGRTVETDDIAALTKARSGLDAPDVEQVCANLLAASRMHQAAFDRWLGQWAPRRAGPYPGCQIPRGVFDSLTLSALRSPSWTPSGVFSGGIERGS